MPDIAAARETARALDEPESSRMFARVDDACGRPQARAAHAEAARVDAAGVLGEEG